MRKGTSSQRRNRATLETSCFSPVLFLALGPVEDSRFFSEGEGLRLHLPTQQADRDFSKPMTVSPRIPQARSPLETRPLLRNSGCSDSSAGGSLSTELRQNSAGDTDDPAPISSCATEMQHHWPHAPVECTELDLQNLSTQAELLHRDDAEKRDARGTLQGRTESCGNPAAEARLISGSPRSSYSSFRSPTAESGEQTVSEAGFSFSGPQGPPQQ